jgi:hypothetical protein
MQSQSPFNIPDLFGDELSTGSSKKSKRLLFILPLVYGILAYMWYYQSGAFFTTFPDSTYIYFINGVNIAGGNFTIGHFDNPGTTAHWMAGIVIFITHLFFGKGTVMQDAVDNPEFYLCACTIACIALLMLSVYAAGKLIVKNTGNYTVALFFQLIPICSYLNVHHIVRICPEYIMIMALPYYCAYMWVLCYKKNNTPDFIISTRSILFLAFVTAGLFIAKITCVPFVFVPLFFLRKIKTIAIYILSTVAFAMLILFPVWPNLGGMYDWFFGLATHTGIYGSGKAQMFDGEEYKNSLAQLLSTEWFFTAGYILSSLGVLVGLVLKKWKDNFYKLSLAFWITISLQLLLAAKHYKFHYIIPSQSLIIPAILAGCASLLNFKLLKIFWGTLFATCSLFLVFKLAWSATDYWDGNSQYKSSKIAERYADFPRIITTSYEESCFPESALHFGAAYGGQSFDDGKAYLREKYPKSWVYEPVPNKLDLFFMDVSYSEVFEKYPQVLVYFRGKDENTERALLANMTAEYSYGIKSIDMVSYYPNTGDRFYIINTDTFITKARYAEKKNIICDFEKMTPDNSYFISQDGFSYFGGANRSTEQHASGTASVKATPEIQYVGWSNFQVKPGDAFEISVNCFAEDMPGGITLSSFDSKTLNKSSQTVTANLGNGWKTVSLKAKVPVNFADKEVRFSLFYFGKKVCYFDDLNITFLKK